LITTSSELIGFEAREYYFAVGKYIVFDTLLVQKTYWSISLACYIILDHFGP